MRDERVARLLDDPEKLRELRQQRAERKAERQQQSKGRPLEHANLVRPGRAGDEIAIASFIGRRESPTRQDQGASGVLSQSGSAVVRGM